MLENPPDALDIVVGKGHVGIVQVNPESGAFGQLLPFIDVLKDIRPTLGVELSHAIFFNLRLALEAQLFLNFNLDGQAMGIPAAASQAVEALHHFIAREHILEGARQHVMTAGFAIGCGRTFIKHVARRVFAALGRALEDSIETPIIELLLLKPVDGFAVDLRVYCSKHELSLLLALM